MKKLIRSAVYILFILGLGSSVAGVGTQPNEVYAEPSKTKCVLTVEGGFFCEGNPGYQEALSRVNEN